MPLPSALQQELGYAAAVSVVAAPPLCLTAKPRGPAVSGAAAAAAHAASASAHQSAAVDTGNEGAQLVTISADATGSQSASTSGHSLAASV